MRRYVLSVAMAVLCLGSANAADTPADSAKYRNAVMESLGGHTAALSLLAMGRVTHPDQLKVHADAIAALGPAIKTVFPAGSAVGDSEALPLIWQEPERFQQAADAADKAAQELKAAAATNDKAATMKAFGNLGKACKGCHDRYRKADD